MEWWKKLKIEQILDKLNSFCSHTMTEIFTLVSVYYSFFKRLDTLDYLAELLKKNKFFYNNIENIGN